MSLKECSVYLSNCLAMFKYNHDRRLSSRRGRMRHWARCMVELRHG